MKNTNKVVALLLIGLLSISSAYANGFPEEPMVIYGNITGATDGKILKIIDGNNYEKAQATIIDNKYGTNKTFELNKKLSLAPFEGNLKFSIEGYTFLGLQKGETNTCETQASFQKGNICEYNLSFQEILSSSDDDLEELEDSTTSTDIVYSGGGGGGGGSSSSSSSSTSSTSTSTSSTSSSSSSSSSSDDNGTDSSETNNDEGNVKRNETGKIIINSKDYIKAVNSFQANKKETKIILGLKVLNIKGDDTYNKNVLKYVKEINNNIQLEGIRKSMAKHLDKMTKTYGMYTDSELDENLKDTFKAKLKEDREYFDFKMKVLKRKDEIIRYNLDKRK